MTPVSSTTAGAIAGFIARILGTAAAKRPLIFGLNGPQGCGKSTATAAAVEILRKRNGLRGIAISIDDFYLTRGEQVQLAAQHQTNSYLQQRGYPGTHDIRLGSDTLSALKAINSAQQPVAIPRYDKSAHEGEGDRMPLNEWQSVMAPLDFVILEGWCVGFTPLPETDIQDAHLSGVNKMLAKYAAWHTFLDAFIQLKAQQIGDVVRWRIEAEQKMRAQGKAGMDDEKIRAYVERFLPAYEMYLPVLEKKPPVSSPRLVIDIGRDREFLIAADQPA